MALLVAGPAQPPRFELDGAALHPIRDSCIVESKIYTWDMGRAGWKTLGLKLAGSRAVAAIYLTHTTHTTI